MPHLKSCVASLIILMCVACNSQTLPTVAVLPTVTNTATIAPTTAIPSETPTVTPSVMITNTPRPSATATVTITNTSEPALPETRTRQELSQSLEMAMLDVEGVASVEMASFVPMDTGNDIVHAEITVSPGFNHPGTADLLRQITYSTLASTLVDFSVILADGRTAPIDYVWDNQTDSWRTTVLESLAPEPIQPTVIPTVVLIPTVPVQSAFTCNCNKTCPAMASCEEAYYQLNNCGCGRRDGDNDGVPCEDICPGG